MGGRYQAYPDYRKTSVEWLGNVPREWVVCLVKHRCSEITDGAHISPDTEDGTEYFISIVDIEDGVINFENALRTTRNSYEYLVRTGCRPFEGDILFSKDGTIGETAITPPDIAFVVASSLIIVRPKRKAALSAFMNYLLQSEIVKEQVESFVKGAALRRLSIQNLRKIWGCFPPIEEQTQIANFLDHETAKIDTLIEKQKQLIELLKEKRRAVISHAVTKGLNPDAPMKDSGVEWLGEVPAHWVVIRLKQISNKITDGEHISPTFTDDGMPFLSAKDIRDRKVDYHVEKFVDFEDGHRFRRRCNPEAGDILIVSRGATIGRVALVEKEHLFCLLGSVILLKPDSKSVSSIFGYYLLSQTSAQEQFLLASQASAQQAIYLVDVAELCIAIPPIIEQHDIENHLENRTGKLAGLMQKAEHQISLLQERRTALISAAVTGKIDVRNWEAPA